MRRIVSSESNLVNSALCLFVLSLWVNGSAAQVASMPFTEDFEAGAALAGYWAVSGTNDHRTAPTIDHNPHGGSWHLGMDDAVQDLTNSRNELTLTIDLAGYENAVLSFWTREIGGDPHGPPSAPFTDGADFDGVAVSEDGVTWYEVAALRDLSSTYSEIVIDLDAAVAMWGISHNDAFMIRFNHYDDHPMLTDGIVLDDIAITGDPIANPTHVWVDFAYTGTEAGTEAEPFNTLAEGVDKVAAGGVVTIKSDTGAILLSQTSLLTKAVRIKVIGRTTPAGRYDGPTMESVDTVADSLDKVPEDEVVAIESDTALNTPPRAPPSHKSQSRRQNRTY